MDVTNITIKALAMRQSGKWTEEEWSEFTRLLHELFEHFENDTSTPHGRIYDERQGDE